MKAMTPKRFELWAKIRRKGRRHYVGSWTLLATITGLLLSLALAMIPNSRLLVTLPVCLAIWPVGGYSFGMWTWWTSEAKYERAVRHRPAT
jgi:hypothetical protein